MKPKKTTILRIKDSLTIFPSLLIESLIPSHSEYLRFLPRHVQLRTLGMWQTEVVCVVPRIKKERALLTPVKLVLWIIVGDWRLGPIDI